MGPVVWLKVKSTQFKERIYQNQSIITNYEGANIRKTIFKK